MSPKPNKPLDVYVRVSQVGGREGESFISLKVQETRCRALARRAVCASARSSPT